MLGAALLAFSVPAISSAGAQTGRITEVATPTADSQPLDIVPGREGSQWLTETKPNKIGRIASDGSITEFGEGITPGAAPAFITLGPDGRTMVMLTYATAAGHASSTAACTCPRMDERPRQVP